VKSNQRDNSRPFLSLSLSLSTCTAKTKRSNRRPSEFHYEKSIAKRKSNFIFIQFRKPIKIISCEINGVSKIRRLVSRKSVVSGNVCCKSACYFCYSLFSVENAVQLFNFHKLNRPNSNRFFSPKCLVCFLNQNNFYLRGHTVKSLQWLSRLKIKLFLFTLIYLMDFKLR